MQTDSIGIIGGTGWLGGALAKALLERAFVQPGQLYISNRSGFHPLAATGVQLVASNQELVDACATVIIAVRPEQFEQLDIHAPDRLLISLMAGVPAQKISAATGSTLVVRAMANAAVEIGQSFTPWYCESDLSAHTSDFVQRLFECVGTASQVPTQDCIDYLSALSGTGPAFPALLMTALSNAAVAAGVPEAVARQAARSVVVSASQLLGDTNPQDVIDSLVAYKGVTAAALQRMVDSDFQAMVGSALQAGAWVARKGM